MYLQSSIFHGNNSPYIKLAFYSVSVRQGTYTRCRTNNKKKKQKNENAEESKTKEETDIVHYSTGTRLVSFHLSFPFTAKWVDRSHYYSPIYSEKNYPIFTIWTKKIQFVPLNVVDFLARSHRTKKSRLGRAREYWSNDKEEREKKKKRLTIPKIDRLSVNFDSNESWLTNIQFVNEARSRPDLIYK